MAARTQRRSSGTPKAGGALRAGLRSRPSVTPLRIPKIVKTVVVFGGTFDPPHLAHARVPLEVVEKLYGASGMLLVVPAAQSPLKQRATTSDEHRLEMLRLALGGDASATRRLVWTDEIDRARTASGQAMAPSYTIDTLVRLRSVLPARAQIRLLIGADQAAQFHRWRAARRIIALAEPLVMAREPIVTVADLHRVLDQRFWRAGERRAWCARMAPNDPLLAASTDVRAALASAPRSARAWANHPALRALDPKVAAYIRAHGLYL